jgi:hypothetical protein
MSFMLASAVPAAALSFDAAAVTLLAVFEPPQATSDASITAVIAMDTNLLILFLFFLRTQVPSQKQKNGYPRTPYSDVKDSQLLVFHSHYSDCNFKSRYRLFKNVK